MAVAWVFRRTPELENRQGLIDVPDAILPRLILEGKAAASYDQWLMMENDPAPGQDRPAPRPSRPHPQPQPSEPAPPIQTPEAPKRPRGRPRKSAP